MWNSGDPPLLPSISRGLSLENMTELEERVLAITLNYARNVDQPLKSGD
jgi:hypothetical protein